MATTPKQAEANQLGKNDDRNSILVFDLRSLAFIRENAKMLLKDIDNYCPLWFTIVSLAMVELSHAIGFKIVTKAQVPLLGDES